MTAFSVRGLQCAQAAYTSRVDLWIRRHVGTNLTRNVSLGLRMRPVFKSIPIRLGMRSEGVTEPPH